MTAGTGYVELGFFFKIKHWDGVGNKLCGNGWGSLGNPVQASNSNFSGIIFIYLLFLYSVLGTSLLWRSTVAFTYLKVKFVKWLCLLPVVLVLVLRIWSSLHQWFLYSSDAIIFILFSSRNILVLVHHCQSPYQFCSPRLHVSERLARVYFKREIPPKCGVQNEKCGVQNSIWSVDSQENH